MPDSMATTSVAIIVSATGPAKIHNTPKGVEIMQEIPFTMEMTIDRRGDHP